MTAALALLLAVAALGALDTFWHHEWRARLPVRTGAQRELRLHAARDFAYAALFGSLAWARWGGHLVWLLGALLLSEITITLLDFIEEDRHRPLEPGERVMHTLIAVVYGAFLALLIPQMMAWFREPTGWHATDHGWLSWLFSAMAVGVFVSGVRDVLAARALDRAAGP